jgi:hypothetical protein
MPQQPILAPVPPPHDETILHFALEGLLLPPDVLALDLSIRTLSRLSYEERRSYPLLLQQAHFTLAELHLLYPLLTLYPAYSPYEVLFASFTRGYDHLNEQTINKARRHLNEAQSIPGAWDAEVRPIRNVLSRMRIKLNALGIDVISMVETGYLLIERGRRIKRVREGA